MAKAKITIITEIEYEMDMANYPGASSPEEALQIDLKTANDDPDLWISMESSNTTIIGKIVE